MNPSEGERVENQWLSAVLELHTTVAKADSSDSREELYQQVVETAAGLFNCSVARLSLAEEDELVPTTSSQDDPIEEIPPVPTTFGYAGQAFQSGEIVRIDDLTKRDLQAQHLHRQILMLDHNRLASAIEPC
ncbi:GAF domain-containing protein [Haloarcula marina]|uniref:GAF domain-containing protein n=1 Tax=Haloarcula marina TaxID=2961574 RepID=UPI0020B70299|nr:GAF domain-containing protein [Halomicroarcula marina]